MHVLRKQPSVNTIAAIAASQSTGFIIGRRSRRGVQLTLAGSSTTGIQQQDRGAMARNTRSWAPSVALLLCCYAATAAAQGQLFYDQPGTYTFTVPSGVTQVSVLCVGGGGGAGSNVGASTTAAGGGGGGMCYGNNIAVTGTKTYQIVVGTGGNGAGSNGQDSLFRETNGPTIMSATGGQGGSTNAASALGGLGGNCTFGAGAGTWLGWGMGGAGGAQNWDPARGGNLAGGGGGAGGYGAAGGRGGSGNPATGGTFPFGGVDNQWGGGASGGGFDSASTSGGPDGCLGCAGGGGGTGVWGRGSPGFGGSEGSEGGIGGSNGDNGVRGRGGFPGGGAGGRVGTSGTQRGGNGACRIIWGTNRVFPNATTSGDVLTGGTVTLTHRLLVLTIPIDAIGTDRSDFLRTVFDGYGLPYEVYYYNPTAPINLNSLFYSSANPQTRTARFSGIVVYPYLENLQFFTKTQARSLEDYSRQWAARIVRFGSDLSRFGLTLAPSTDGIGPMTVAATAPVGLSGIRTNAPLSGSGLFRFPANSVAANTAAQCLHWSTTGPATESCTVTPVMTEPGNLVSAISVSYPDTRRNALVFSMDCAAFSSSCLLLAHWAVSYLTRDILPGLRRSLLSTHVDDLFLSTDIYGRPGVSYRTTAADMNAHASWQATLRSSMPTGTSFRVEMAYNGHGVLLQVNDPGRLTNASLSYSCRDDPRWTNPITGCVAPSVTGGNCWALTTSQCQANYPTAPQFCWECNYRWQRPYPDNTYPFNRNSIPTGYTSATWGTQTLWNTDALAANVRAETALRFFWTSHTFTHQNLNNVSQYDANLQWRLQQDFEARMLMTLPKGVSRLGVVPPQITGLFSRGNLLALTGLTYRVATGDNTWTFLTNPANPYHMLRTNQSFNNFGVPGDATPFWIMPRFATEIYFNVNDTASEEALYNFIYTGPNKPYQTQQTFDQILDREVERVTRSMFALRHDAHMFHQANLATNGGVLSLLQRWVNAVTARLMQLVSWPVESLKMDDLYNLYLQRQSRDACNLEYQIQVNLNARRVTQVTATRRAGAEACLAPLLIPSAATVTTSAGAGPVAVAGARTLQFNMATLNAAQTLLTSTAGLAW